MEVRGILDRIEDDKYAVILVEELGKEYVIDKDQLPPDLSIGDWSIVSLKNEKIIQLFKDKKKTSDAKNVTKQKLEKVKSKSTNSKFKKR
ncbi:Protein of unknown function (DUF3006) [Sinobaca qinghaiensis]|uniref:DUF3006 family protein n=1 Tax=Sinobaca qinghaiensis TaxID=342944 RepID=A0A419V0J9_9BACL|nr:DUF3006 domain-containing protein [Sinobaca qinghaiensis]RKD71390.1 Protein of unknown function (DUF3006) [Sinobaca qinghaiensis]